MNHIKAKHILAVIVTTCYFILPQTGYGENTSFATHLLFPLCHGNIFHLCGNMLCLLLIKGPLFLIPATIINFISSYLPIFGFYGPIKCTMGISGVLFAIVGIKYGKYGTFKNMSKQCLPCTIGMAVLPHINWCIHLYCLFFGYLYGFIWKRFKHS